MSKVGVCTDGVREDEDWDDRDENGGTPRDKLEDRAFVECE